MALFDNGFKGNLWTGLAIGVGASILAPAIIPTLSRIVKPVVKSAIKSWLIIRERGKEIMATTAKVAPEHVEHKPDHAERLKLKTLTGKVKEVNRGTRTVTIARKVRGNELQTTVNVDEEAVIRMGSPKKKLTNVKKGDKVVIKYIEIAGKKRSKSLSLLPLQKVDRAAKKTKSS